MSTKVAQQRADFDHLIAYSKKGKLPSLIIESSEDAIKTKTLAGIITSWNKGSEKIFGYKASEVIGKNISSLIPPTGLLYLPPLTALRGSPFRF